MTPLEKTVQLLRESKLPKERIAADTSISLTTVYAIMRQDGDPSYSKVARLYEYLSGRRLEV